MSVNKLLPATLVLLALASSTATAACSVSEQSALDGTTHTFTGTTLEADTLVPMTTETMTFKSDGDGIGSDPTKSITTSTSGDKCQFTVACPSGFFVYLNVSAQPPVSTVSPPLAVASLTTARPNATAAKRPLAKSATFRDSAHLELIPSFTHVV